MAVFQIPKSPIYRGLFRVFVVIAIMWTGLIAFWIRDEHFDLVRPDAEMAERVERWFAEIDTLTSRGYVKLDELPKERASLIQKAANTGVYQINGREQKLTESELKGYKAIVDGGFSTQVKDTLALVSKEIDPAKSLCGLEHCDRYIYSTPKWDFRGVDGLYLESLKDAVRRTTHQLNEIQTFKGWEKHFALGTVQKWDFSGEYTGLVTEKDMSLLYALSDAQKSRWILKPLFWLAAWIVPVVSLGLVTFVLVELCRWIVRGFRPSTQTAQ